MARAETERGCARPRRMLGIGELLARKPGELSGGQRQRVALGRALIRDPVAFLLDEPLSNLDAKLRAGMRTELIKLHRQLGRTVIHVTHDQVEAMTMGERICIMNHGRIVQVGPPMEVYRNPADTFVAGFLASPPMNLLDAHLQARPTDGRVRRADAAHTRRAMPVRRHRDRAVILGIRPEDIHEQRSETGLQPLDLHVVAVEAFGPEIILIGSPPGAGAPEIAARMGRDFQAPIGATQRVYVDTDEIHLFDPATTAAIPRGPRTASAGARDAVRSL